MKKLVIVFMACVAMTFASCGNQTASDASSVDTDSVAVDSLDTLVADSVVVTDSLVVK